MPEHRNCQRFDIIRQHMIAGLEGGARLPGPEESQTATRTCAKIYIPTVACASDQVNDIFLDGGRDVNLADFFNSAQQILSINDRLQRVNRMAELLLAHDPHLL